MLPGSQVPHEPPFMSGGSQIRQRQKATFCKLRDLWWVTLSAHGSKLLQTSCWLTLWPVSSLILLGHNFYRLHKLVPPGPDYGTRVPASRLALYRRHHGRGVGRLNPGFTKLLLTFTSGRWVGAASVGETAPSWVTRCRQSTVRARSIQVRQLPVAVSCPTSCSPPCSWDSLAIRGIVRHHWSSGAVHLSTARLRPFSQVTNLHSVVQNDQASKECLVMFC